MKVNVQHCRQSCCQHLRLVKSPLLPRLRDCDWRVSDVHVAMTLGSEAIVATEGRSLDVNALTGTAHERSASMVKSQRYLLCLDRVELRSRCCAGRIARRK